MRCAISILMGAVLAACGQNDRPLGQHCEKDTDSRMAAMDAAAPDASGPAGGYTPFSMSSRLETRGVQERRPARVTVYNKNRRLRDKLAAIFEDPARTEINILSVSAGGEFGAFGAGFLNGLAARPGASTRYDVVTGVSTGALLAPLAFLGREKDYQTLKDQYTTVTDRDLISERSKLQVAFSNSLYTTEKLRKRISSIVTAEFVTELARIAREEKRVLAVMAVNLDSGRPEIFDLTAIAAGEGKYESLTPGKRRDRIVDAMAASSSIPIAFPPVFIDGNMYADGGARQHAFIGAEMAVAAAGDAEPAATPGPGLRTYSVLPGRLAKPINLFVLVNGDYRIETDCTGNSIFGVAGRTFSVTVNQMLYDSIFRLLTNARNQGWRARVADARLVTDPAETDEPCVRKESDGFFSRPFMQCLYRRACEKAAGDARPWCEGMDCLPTELAISEPGPSAPPAIPAVCRIDSGDG